MYVSGSSAMFKYITALIFGKILFQCLWEWEDMTCCSTLCVGCIGCSCKQDGGSSDEVGLRVTAPGAEDTTGATGIWPRTRARDQKLANLQQFHSSPHVCYNIMLCSHWSTPEIF